MDAAIAANATLTVVEPMMNGIGGDLFAIYREGKSGKITGINASGWAPKAMDVEFLRGKGHQSMPQDGILSVTVPECVDGWEKLHKRHGKLPWGDLFQPALFYADWVHPIATTFSNLRSYRQRLLARPSFARAVDEARPYRELFPPGAPDRD